MPRTHLLTLTLTLLFLTLPDLHAEDNAIYVDGNGKVGINVADGTALTEQLEVNGNLLSTSVIRANGALRLPNTVSIQSGNAGDAEWIGWGRVDTSNRLNIGDDARLSLIYLGNKGGGVETHVRATDGMNEGGRLFFEGSGAFTNNLYLRRFQDELRVMHNGVNTLQLTPDYMALVGNPKIKFGSAFEFLLNGDGHYQIRKNGQQKCLMSDSAFWIGNSQHSWLAAIINTDYNTSSVLGFRHGAEARWDIDLHADDNDGDDDGSGLHFTAYDDGGSFIDYALILYRSQQASAVLSRNLRVNSNNGATANIVIGGNKVVDGINAATEIGSGRTGSGYAYLDLISDDYYVDYGARLIRTPGQNGNAQLVNRGGGRLILEAYDMPGSVEIKTNGTARFKVGWNGEATFYDTVYAYGDAHVTGELTAGVKNFEIDHPLAPTDRILRHSAVEAPRLDLIYRGKVRLEQGVAVVDIDAASGMSAGTFVALTTNRQVFVSNDEGWDRVRGQVVDGTLRIESKNSSSTDVISWMIVAERRDPSAASYSCTDEQGRLIVEQDKEPAPSDLAVNDPLPEGDVGVEVPVERARRYRGYVMNGKAYPQRAALPKRRVSSRYADREKIHRETVDDTKSHNEPLAPGDTVDRALEGVSK